MKRLLAKNGFIYDMQEDLIKTKLGSKPMLVLKVDVPGGYISFLFDKDNYRFYTMNPWSFYNG
jgi:hypothetical protein